MSELVRFEESAHGLVWISMHRAQAKNALSTEMLEGLARAVDAAAQAKGARLVAFIGSSTAEDAPRVFCAGADLIELAGVPLERARSYLDRFAALLEAIERLAIPTVAAIEGVALGGGLELALACDFRVAAANVRLGLPEVAVGTMPGAGGTQRLPKIVGVPRAKSIAMFGEPIGADDARAIGLVDAVGEVRAIVERWAEVLSTRAPIAVREIKSAIDRGARVQLREGLAIERAAFERLFATEDSREGVQAFREKRRPQFRGL